MNYPLIAAQLYTVRDFTKTPKEIAISFKKVKEIGYTSRMQATAHCRACIRHMKH